MPRFGEEGVLGVRILVWLYASACRRQRLGKNDVVADMICQQEHQFGVEQFALPIAETLMRTDQRLIEIVRRC